MKLIIGDKVIEGTPEEIQEFLNKREKPVVKDVCTGVAPYVTTGTSSYTSPQIVCSGWWPSMKGTIVMVTEGFKTFEKTHTYGDKTYTVMGNSNWTYGAVSLTTSWWAGFLAGDKVSTGYFDERWNNSMKELAKPVVTINDPYSNSPMFDKSGHRCETSCGDYFVSQTLTRPIAHSFIDAVKEGRTSLVFSNTNGVSFGK